MKFLLIIAVLSMVVNAGAGFLLKRAWQAESDLQGQLQHKQAELEREINVRDQAIKSWRDDYVELSTTHYEVVQRLQANARAREQIERELNASKRRLNELAQADPVFLECTGVSMPDGYARELFGDQTAR